MQPRCTLCVLLLLNLAACDYAHVRSSKLTRQSGARVAAQEESKNLLLPYYFEFQALQSNRKDLMERARAILENEASGGNSSAAYKLGILYRDGPLIDIDTDLALVWLNSVPPHHAERPAARYAIACIHYRLSIGLSREKSASVQSAETRIEKLYAFNAMRAAAEDGYFLAIVDLAAYYRR